MCPGVAGAGWAARFLAAGVSLATGCFPRRLVPAPPVAALYVHAPLTTLAQLGACRARLPGTPAWPRRPGHAGTPGPMVPPGLGLCASFSSEPDFRRVNRLSVYFLFVFGKNRAETPGCAPRLGLWDALLRPVFV